MFKYYGQRSYEDLRANSLSKLNTDLNVYIDPSSGDDTKMSPVYKTPQFAFGDVRENYYPANKSIVFNFLAGDHVIDSELYLLGFNTANSATARVILKGEADKRSSTRLILRGNRARIEAQQCPCAYTIQDLSFVGETTTVDSTVRYPSFLRVVQNSSVYCLDCTLSGEFDTAFIAANFGYLRQRRITFENVNSRRLYFSGNAGKIDFNEPQPLLGNNEVRDCAVEIRSNGSIFVGNNTSFNGSLAGQKYRIYTGAGVEIIEPSFTLDSFPGDVQGEVVASNY